MGKYQAYPDYKDSGVIGLDQIPFDWSTKKVKYLFNIGRGRVISQEELVDEGEFPVYSSQTANDGCLGYISSYDFDCEQITWTTDGANAGTVFLRNGKHNCTNVCGTLQPKTKEQNLKFFLYCLQYVTQFYKRPDTNGAKIMNGEMAEIVLTEPTDDDKLTIANFLDHETAKIDTLIEQQQQLIQLLKEKRQAVISHAVTKGLNPDAPMKDSGVEWLGEVPAHWDICCLKHVVSQTKDAMVDGPFGSSVNTETDYVDDGVPVIRTVNITNMGFSSENLKYMRVEKFEQLKRHAVYPGDILFSKVGTIGNSCVLPESISHAILSTTGSCKITINDNMCATQYLVFSIQLMNQDLMQIANSNVQPFLNMTNIKNLKIVLPPMNEQIGILNYLEDKIKKIDDVLNEGISAEVLLRERRTALISAAVTGKIDVRNWQAPQQ